MVFAVFALAWKASEGRRCATGHTTVEARAEIVMMGLSTCELQIAAAWTFGQKSVVGQEFRLQLNWRGISGPA
jgi:hypothetical protein